MSWKNTYSIIKKGLVLHLITGNSYENHKLIVKFIKEPHANLFSDAVCSL